MTTTVPNPSPAACEERLVVTSDDSIELETEFAATDSRLIVRFRVTNHRDTDVYFANRANSTIGAANLVPRSDGVVEISRREYTAPDCLALLNPPPPRPLTVRVEPRRTVAEEFEVPLPFVINHPLLGAETHDLAPLPPRPYPTVFCIGIVPPKVDRPEQDRTSNLYAPTDFDFAEQVTLCSPVHGV